MIESFEGLRGLAALIVALYHLKIGAAHFSLIKNGYLFVDLFFVLSGFVMCASYGRKLNYTSDIVSFFIRRVGRLGPLLIFSTVTFILASDFIVLMKRIAFASGHAGVLNHPDALAYSFPNLSEVLATLTFSQGMGVFDHLILNTPSWSISVEFYTYLVFAFICLWANGKAQNLLFCLFSIAGFLVSVWASATVHNCLNEGGCLSLTYDFGYARSVFSFFLGALLCRANPITPSQKIAAQALGVALLFLIFMCTASMPPLAFMAPAAFGLLIASMQKDAGILAGLLKSRPLQILGQRSFSIYLMHMPLLLFFENIAKRTHGVVPSVLVLVAYAGSVVWVSGFTYRFIENPMRIRFNRIARQIQAPRESPTLLRVEK